MFPSGLPARAPNAGKDGDGLNVHGSTNSLRSFAASPALPLPPPVTSNADPTTLSIRVAHDGEVHVDLAANFPPPPRLDTAMASVLRHLADSCSGAPTRLRLLCVRAINTALEAAATQALSLPVVQTVVANHVCRVFIEVRTGWW